MSITKTIIAISLLVTLLLVGCKKEKRIDEPGNLVPKTVDQDPTLPSIFINGTLLHAEVFGHPDSALLVILHGGPGAADYRSLLNFKEFANHGFRVVFFDQRGSGLSKREEESNYSLKTDVEDLHSIISHYKTSSNQKVFIMGHSWGGMLASLYVGTYPKEVDGLILAEVGGLVWKDVKDYVARSRSSRLFSEFFNDITNQDQFITGKEDDQTILDYKLGLQAIDDKENPIGNEAQVPFWRFGAVCNRAHFLIGEKENPDMTIGLNLFTTKVLFLYSQNNKGYGPAHAQKVSSAYPNVQIVEAKDAGHDMFTFSRGWNNTYPLMLNYLNALK